MKTILIFLFIVFTSVSSKQTQAQNFLGFENAGNGWTTNHSDYLSVSNNRAANGDYSLKFSIDKNANNDFAASGLISIDTKHTISKVRTAQFNETKYVIASSYQGFVMAIAYDGSIIWKNKLSGFMNQDLWCADITGDGNDEILTANADGTVYCLNSKGELLWQFKKNSAPMYTVCVVKKGTDSYVVCGGFDMIIYYLSASGELIKEIKSSGYSVEKTWGTGILPPNNVHVANFLRPMKKSDGTEILVQHGTNNHMQVKGTIYQFDVLADLPFHNTKVDAKTVIGDVRVLAVNADNSPGILMGTSGHHNNMAVVKMNPEDGSMSQYELENLGFGYSVTQCELITDGDNQKYLFLVGNRMFLVPLDFNESEAERLECSHSFNDLWKDSGDNIILASVQSGGSCIHILDTKNEAWKESYKNIAPQGKMSQILANTETVWENLNGFEKYEWEREPLPVYLMTEKYDTQKSSAVANNIIENYNSPVFLNGAHTGDAENWDRSEMENEKYKNKRDQRRDYVLTQQQSIDLITSWYEDYPGIAYWGGHGNDPYMWQLSTTKQVLDFADDRKTVLTYPELEDHTEDFAWVMNDLFYPLAEYAQDKNANIYVRTKHAFWQSNIYLPMWSRLMSGEFADVFVPSMEETTDKSMELSLVGRLGIWASGAVNGWGSRSVPDNPSYDRSRQFSHQIVPNHFLRHSIYSIANGAQYINNFATNPDYMCLLWELIAKGALYVPKANEILSYSPVHLSMLQPDEHYMNEASNVKWSTFYNQEFEENNPFVFSRLNGSWPAAPVTEWDFSKYAAGVHERRSNFLPPYENGKVLITPPQNGIYADKDAPRGALKDRLHPIYQDILKEYYTDGKNYYSADGTQTYAADEYYTTIENDIKSSASQLPLTVSGKVAWVLAQTSPTHLRLTLIDGGYLNPDDRKAKITFHSINPVKMEDVLDGEKFDASGSDVTIEVPCGMFRFIDIELNEPLQ